MTAMTRPPRLCFVAHFAYPALAGRTSGHIGGVERQTALMSRWFAARGYDVSVVTWDEGQPDGQDLSGVRVLTLCRKDAGLPGLRFVVPRWTALARALRRADADVYYQNCGEYVTGQVALWCGWHARRFVYSVASSMDCDPRLPEMKTRRERVLYRYGVRHADRVVVQTRGQAAMLHEGFGRDAQVIAMPGRDMAGEAPGASPSARGRRRVLWLGRLNQVKRPDRLLDLAECRAELDFDLVGPEDGTSYAWSIVQRARALPNVRVHGRAVDAQIRELLGQALCLVSTSDFEGFPNTFLEAWSAGVPVVSTIDPDGVIERVGLGGVAADIAGLSAHIGALADSPRTCAEIARRARRYFVEHHSIDHVLPEFERVFLDVTAGQRPDRHAHAAGGSR